MAEPPRRRPHPPRDRAVPLPVSIPKAAEDDTEALDRIRTLLEHPSYLRADRDVALLQRDELRAVRLMLDYLKAELALRDHGVESTIVLFGGTRIAEPRAAARAVADARRAVATRPDDPAAAAQLRVLERIEAKSGYYDVARRFAQLVSAACQGNGCRYVIVTGGGPGIMEAGNRGAYDIGAKTVGLNITIPMEQFPNPYVTPGLALLFRYFALRKLHFMKRAKALVAFPGGYGTFDELFEGLCLVQTRVIEPLPIVLVGREYWERAVDFEFLAAEGVIDPEDLELFCYAETAEEIWEHIREAEDAAARE
jgi:uncharacterized protein (TIGR00730 family)